MRTCLYRRCLSATACAAIAMSGLANLQAELVRPAGATATSYWFYEQHPLNLINGSGLSAEDATATHAEGYNDIWHADVGYATAAFTGGGVVANQSLVLTLPGVYDLSQAHIWQMNQPALPGRGVNQYDLLVSSDGVNYTPVISDGNLIASAGGPIAAQSPTFTTQSNVRFVKLQIDSAHSGLESEYVGLSEIRFEGGKTGSGPIFTKSTALNSAGLPIQPSNSDLLEGKIGTSNMTTYGGAGIDQLTNGIGDADNSHRAVTDVNGGIWEVTYDASQLNLGAGQSLNVNQINVFSFSDDFEGSDFDFSRRYSDFDVWYRTSDGGEWKALFLGAATGYTNEPEIALISLTREDSLDIIEGVRELRFDFRPVTGFTRTGGDEWHSGIVEIDVLGSVATPLSGDFDGDGDVDGADFVAWQTNFPTPSGATSQMGDADGDADVDGADFAAWQSSFPGSGGSVTPIPEPVSMVLLLLGCTIALAWRRRGED